jgi:hypothetical protein
MNNLGYKSESMNVPSKPGKKMSYPHLCIRDKSLEAAFGKEMPQVGEEIEATVKLRVTGIRNDEYGKSVDFDVVSGEFGEPEEGEDMEESENMEEDGPKEARY